MTPANLMDLSLEQTIESIGDPTQAVFTIMYEKFPDLAEFRVANDDWENYMMQEIFQNLMEFSQDPAPALITIKDMLSHHQLIGVSVDIFKGMYQTLFDVLSPNFFGPHKEEMLILWQEIIVDIEQYIDKCIESLY